MSHARPTRRTVLQGIGAAALLSHARDLAFALEQGQPADFASVVKRRRMIRRYTDRPVSEDAVTRLLRYAVRAPSAGNLQPWEFIVVRDPAVRADLAKAAMNQRSVATAPVIVATCADVQRMGEKYGTRGAFYSLVDTAFASLLILLGATEQGLGACFVGAYDPAAVAKIFGLPDHVRPVGLITLGHPAEEPRKPSGKRIPLERLIHENVW